MDPTMISATLSSEDQQAILAAANTIRQKLPFLIDLNTQDRKGMQKLGNKTVGFVQKALQIANEHQSMFATTFLDEMRKDAQLLDALLPIHVAIQTIAKKIDDTAMQTGAEAYAAARTVYNLTKTPFGKAPLRQAAQDLAQQYTRKKKTQSATTKKSGAAPAAAATPATPTHPAAAPEMPPSTPIAPAPAPVTPAPAPTAHS